MVAVQRGPSIYGKANLRMVVPFHSSTILHPKVVKQVRGIIEESTAR
jgi:predicted RNA binding protein YcfA (HicA-like mRNA interferase family)